jgi:tetratricopeptide (TPR) repeat protein
MMFRRGSKKPAKLPFSSGNSLRLCTEALQALERYERDRTAGDLEAAERELSKCVQRYPGDMLPKFYLGSVKTLVGYRGLDEAVMLLSDVAENGPPDLKITAQYNLAVAYIERYNEDGFQKAEAILESLAKDAKRREFWSARVELLYIQAHRIWSFRYPDRRKGPIEDRRLRAAIPEVEKALEKFWKGLKESKFRGDSEFEAGYWNALGTLAEAMAGFVPEKREEYGREAEHAFEQARQDPQYWFYATSNLARLYSEVLNDPTKSRSLWAEILKARPNDEYAEFNLGLDAKKEGKLEEACGHFERAPNIPEAVEALERLRASTPGGAG